MEAENTISVIIEHLQEVKGVTAIVMGGSRARGTHNQQSDIDIGIYYDSFDQLDIAGLQRAAQALDDAQRDSLVTEIGSWGPWINGGGWLQVHQTPVDFLYRDLKQVAQVMDQCLSGVVTIDYQPGHPHGFASSIYFSEVALCKVLWDPSGVIGDLKTRTTPYPPVLKKAIVEKFFWETAFALETGKKGIYKTDVTYVAGCWFRSITCLNQVLFALNECYWMNEKGAVSITDSFRLVPTNYRNRVNEILTLLGTDPDQLNKSMNLLSELISETEELLK